MASAETSSEPEPKWALLNYVREGSPPESDDGAPNVHLTSIRAMGAEEVGELQAAITAVTSLRSASQVRPFEQATQDALEVMDGLIEMGSHAVDDPEDQVLPNLALDQWLSQALVTKSRMLRDAKRSLGGDAKKWLRLGFDDLFENHPDWRMVHEWRNASQHRLPSLQLTQIHLAEDEGATWTMNPRAIRNDLERDGKWPGFVLDRIDEGPDLRAVMISVWEAVATLYAGFLVAHESQIRAMMSVILRLLAESQGEHPGGRVVSNMADFGASTEDGILHWGSWIPLRYPSVEAMTLDLVTATERTSQVKGD